MGRLTFKISENGKERSKVVFQTNDWYEASEWITKDAHAHHCIQYEGISGMTVDEFNALNDDPRWPIKVKKVIIE